MSFDAKTPIEDTELRLLLEGLAAVYGYDFRDYAAASMKRRVHALMRKTGCQSISLLQHEILHNRDFFVANLPDLTVSVSEMFRDPTFYSAFRRLVVPVLHTYSNFKIWHAGCSRGEEVYSLAILLHEEGLLDRATIHATDINTTSMAVAKEGIYSLEEVKKFTDNYHRAGGVRPFHDYYTAAYGWVKFDPTLRRNVVFSEHNLVTDDVFTETHVILCRNVLIYFNRPLQDRVLNLFTRSLLYKGFLCLGTKESIKFLADRSYYEDVELNERILRKINRDNPQIINHSLAKTMGGNAHAL